MKKYFFLFILIIGCYKQIIAQQHEIGFSIGSANIIGDIGKSNYIDIFPDNMNRLPISIGALYRYNLNNRQSIRFNLIYNQVYFDDYHATEDYRYARGITDKNNIIELSSVFEYNFFDINDVQEFALSPYIFGGLALYASNDRDYTITHSLYRNSNGQAIGPFYPQDFNTTVSYNNSLKSNIGIPFGVGYKMKLNYNWLVSFEVGARYTFQNNLDYSALPNDKFNIDIKDNILRQDPYIDEINKRDAIVMGRHQTGNTFKSNDWYVIWGLNITYTFGRPPCFCY